MVGEYGPIFGEQIDLFSVKGGVLYEKKKKNEKKYRLVLNPFVVGIFPKCLRTNNPRDSANCKTKWIFGIHNCVINRFVLRRIRKIHKNSFVKSICS